MQGPAGIWSQIPPEDQLYYDLEERHSLMSIRQEFLNEDIKDSNDKDVYGEREAFARKDTRQGPFDFWGRLRGNRHCTSPKHSHFNSYTIFFQSRFHYEITNLPFLLFPGIPDPFSKYWT